MLKLTKNILQKTSAHPRVYSAIQPTGVPHLGNYLGAIKNWSDMSEKSTLINKDKYIFALADLHAMTISYDKNNFHQTILETAASLIASGLDPTEKCILYRQSHVKQHSELYYLLSCFVNRSELQDMTTWKQKKMQHGESKFGLFVYPVLMTADILLFRPDLIPVGDDNDQNMQLCRNVVKRFNNKYAKSKKFSDKKLIIPKTVYSKVPRVKSLTNPNKKMSKSDPDKNSCIILSDNSDQIKEKVMKNAVLDENGVENMKLICRSLANNNENLSDFNFNNDTEKFRQHSCDILVEKLGPITEKFNNLMQNPDYLEKILRDGKEQAEEIAERELEIIKRLILMI